MKKVLNIIGIIFSILLTVVMFSLELLLTINLILNTFITKDNLGEIIENLLTSNNRNNAILITYADEYTYGNYITYADDTKIDYASVAGKIKEYLVNSGFTKEEATEIVNDKEFKEIVNNYLESVVVSKIKDTKIEYPTKEEIKKFVKKNYKALSKVEAIKEKYNEETIEEIVDENYDAVIEKLDEATNEVKVPDIEEIVYLKKVINISPFLIIGGLLGVILLMMLARMSTYKWLAWSSVPTFFSGLLFSALGLFGMNLVESLINLDKYSEVLDPIAKRMSTLMIRYGIVTIIITIVMIVTYSIIKNKSNKNETIRPKKA